jgi:hypothetical protein
MSKTLFCALFGISMTAAGAIPPGQTADEKPVVTYEDLPATDLVPSAFSWVTVGSRDGQVIRTYNDLLNTTEIWMKLTPHPEESGENPTTLYFSAVFRGRTLKVTPDRVWVRAQSNLSVQATRLRTQTLALTANGVALLHVIDPKFGAAAWPNYPCDPNGGPCTFDGMVGGMPIVSFLRLIQTDRIFGEALGFTFTLSKDQVQMLADFAKQLLPAPY